MVLGVLAVVCLFFAALLRSPLWSLIFLAVAILGFGVASSTRRKAREMTRAACATPGLAVLYRGWDGTMHTFDFEREEAGLKFMAANRGKLLNVTHDASTKLDSYSYAKPSSPPGPVRPVLARPAPRDSHHEALLNWITRVESAKGPSARRATIQAGLAAMVSTADLRHRFAVEAAKIETRVTLEKVESLKSAAAKKRHLTEAIAQLKADPVDDDLQREELRVLEDALRTLP